MTPDLIYGLACDGLEEGNWWEIGENGVVVPDMTHLTHKTSLVGIQPTTTLYRAYGHVEAKAGERGHVYYVILYRDASKEGPDPAITQGYMDQIVVDFTRQILLERKFIKESPDAPA